MIELPDWSLLADKTAPGQQEQRIIEAVREIQTDGGGGGTPDVDLRNMVMEINLTDPFDVPLLSDGNVVVS